MTSGEPDVPAVMRGIWPKASTGDDDALFGCLNWHGVVPLAWERLSRSGAGVPDAFASRLRRLAAALALGNDRLDRHVEATLARLAAAGVTSLLMKGAALGQTHYPPSGLRPRCDNDLLVAEADRGKAIEVLLGAGFRRSPAIDGPLVTCQATLVHEEPPGFPHVYDLHWRISNRRVIAERFPYDELLARSVTVPSLGPHARALGTVDALLLACAHRVAHHADHEKLIWLYDIHLLVESLDEAGFAEFAARADRKHLARICRSGLGRAREVFGTGHPALDSWLAQPDPPEHLTEALFRDRGHLGGIRSDWQALATWAGRFGLLRQHLLPSPAYMMSRYGVRHRWLLPLAYGRRALKGLALVLRGTVGRGAAVARPGAD